MKTLTCLFACLLSFAAFSQKKILTRSELLSLQKSVSSDSNKSSPEIGEGEKKELDYKLKGFNLGLGIGANVVLNRNISEAVISPIDQTLQFDNIPRTNLNLSTLFMIPLASASARAKRYALNKGIAGAKVYQVGEPNNEKKTYVVPYGLHLVVNVNYSDFTKSAAVKPFNQTINGGFGLGWRFNDIAMVAATLEANTFKQPRNFLRDLEGQTLLSTIDTSNTNYFRDITTWCFSIKVIFILSQTED